MQIVALSTLRHVTFSVVFQNKSVHKRYKARHCPLLYVLFIYCNCWDAHLFSSMSPSYIDFASMQSSKIVYLPLHQWLSPSLYQCVLLQFCHMLICDIDTHVIFNGIYYVICCNKWN